MQPIYKAKIAAMIPAIPAKEAPTCMLLAAPVAVDLADSVPVAEAAEPVAEPEPEVATDPLPVPVAVPVAALAVPVPEAPGAGVAGGPCVE